MRLHKCPATIHSPIEVSTQLTTVSGSVFHPQPSEWLLALLCCSHILTDPITCNITSIFVLSPFAKIQPAADLVINKVLGSGAPISGNFCPAGSEAPYTYCQEGGEACTCCVICRDAQHGRQKRIQESLVDLQT